MRAPLFVLATFSLAACGGGGTADGGDGGGADGSTHDAGTHDGATPDLGAPDMGMGVPPGHPVVFYTDLASAPASAYVTLFGHGFGSTRGSGTVALSGTEVARYLSWTDGEIELQLGTSPVAGDLVVHTSAGDSPPFPLGVHAGRLLFVAPSGDDAAAGSEAAPFRTPRFAVDAMQAGDVLYFRGGSYGGMDAYNATLSLHDLVTGTATQPVALVGYPTETATIGDGTVARGIWFYRGDTNPPLDYVTIAKLHFLPTCEASSVGSQTGESSHGRFVANEISGASDACEDGVFTGSASTDWKVLGNYLHGNGNTKLEHGIYLGGYGTMTGWELGWNRIDDQHGGRGIQIYGHTPGDTITGVRIHDNTITEIDRDGIVLGATDADVLHLGDVRIWNDVFVHAGRCVGAAIRVTNPGADDVHVWHETFVDCGMGDHMCDQSTGEAVAQIQIEGGVHVDVANSIFTASMPAAYWSDSTTGVVTASHDLYSGLGAAPSFDTGATSGNPMFAGASDFHLLAGSAAIDHGIDVGIVADRDGVARPQGSAPDVGAYEFAP